MPILFVYSNCRSQSIFRDILPSGRSPRTTILKLLIQFNMRNFYLTLTEESSQSAFNISPLSTTIRMSIYHDILTFDYDLGLLATEC